MLRAKEARKQTEVVIENFRRNVIKTLMPDVRAHVEKEIAKAIEEGKMAASISFALSDENHYAAEMMKKELHNFGYRASINTITFCDCFYLNVSWGEIQL